MTTRVCTRCRAATEPALLERAAGEAKPLELCVRGMPVLTCAHGHRQFVSAAFPRLLVEHLMQEDESRLPAGREKGLLMKHYLCSGCGAELARQADHRETFALDVSLRDFEAFRVELTAPVYRCPACSRQQLHSLKEIQERTPEALAQAFRAADIPPS